MVVIGGQMVVLLVVALVVETSHHRVIWLAEVGEKWPAHSGSQPCDEAARSSSIAISMPRV